MVKAHIFCQQKLSVFTYSASEKGNISLANNPLGAKSLINIETMLIQYHDSVMNNKARVERSRGPVVQSIVSLTSFLRGQLINCFMTL